MDIADIKLLWKSDNEGDEKIDIDHIKITDQYKNGSNQGITVSFKLYGFNSTMRSGDAVSFTEFYAFHHEKTASDLVSGSVTLRKDWLVLFLSWVLSLSL